MPQMRIPVEEFDLEGFVDRTADFIAAMEENPADGAACIDRFGSVPVHEFGPDSGAEALSILNEKKEAVFFPFTYSDGEFLICADRIEYSLFFVEDYDQVEKFIDPADSVGYLVQLEDGTMVINSAIRNSRGIDLCPDVGFLESPLENFILGFRHGKRARGKECVDCGCTEGKLHEYGCDEERCPFCGEQLTACDCRYQMLGLIDGSHVPETGCWSRSTDEEGLTPEQEKQWIKTLYAKGRRPFIEWPQTCCRCGKMWPLFFNVTDEDWERYIDPNQRGEIVCRECYLEIRTLIDSCV